MQFAVKVYNTNLARSASASKQVSRFNSGQFISECNSIKSVHIWQSYYMNKSGSVLWLTVCIMDKTSEWFPFSSTACETERRYDACHGDITRSSSCVHIGRVVAISFQILRRQVSGRYTVTCWRPRWRLMTVDAGRAAAAVDGWTEFTADHLSARRSTTDLTRAVEPASSPSITAATAPAASCVIPFVFIASPDCLSPRHHSGTTPRRCATTTHSNDKSCTHSSVNETRGINSRLYQSVHSALGSFFRVCSSFLRRVLRHVVRLYKLAYLRSMHQKLQSTKQCLQLCFLRFVLSTSAVGIIWSWLPRTWLTAYCCSRWNVLVMHAIGCWMHSFQPLYHWLSASNRPQSQRSHF